MTSREHAQPAGRSSGNTLFYISCAIAAALLTVFGVLADQVVDGDTASFDYSFVMLFRDPATPSVPIGPPWFNEAVRDVTALGSFSVLGILVIGVVLHLLLTGSRRTSLLIAISVLGGTTISMVLKALFDRPRPDFTGAVDVFTASFPSGHATASAVVYLTIGVLLAQRASTWPARTLYLLGAIILVAAIGLSRIYLGVHFPTDILAGWALGAAWALICLAVAHALQRRGTLRDETPPGPPTETA
ncbi:MAG: phosphatase PAP2 family protein [Devosia sp.]